MVAWFWLISIDIHDFLWCYSKAWANGQWWSVMGSCPSLAINGPYWLVMGSDGQLPITAHGPYWAKNIMIAPLCELTMIHSEKPVFQLIFSTLETISQVFWSIFAISSQYLDFVWWERNASTNGQWWAVMGSCPSLSIKGPSWAMNIIIAFLPYLSKILSVATDFPIDFATFP